MFSLFKKGTFIVSGILFCFNVFADADHHGVGMNLNSDGLSPVRADSHAPIGVMGEHMHKKGEWMLSYRYMYMDMEGNRIGETEVSPEFIVANIARFNVAGNLRVVPTAMTM